MRSCSARTLRLKRSIEPIIEKRAGHAAYSCACSGSCYNPRMEKRTGGCHCGKVRYEAEVDLEQPVIECNCSHCEIKGLLITFVPRESFRLISGEGEMTEYLFNTEQLHHMFCSTCGVESFATGEKDGAKMYGVNVRTIDDIDLEKLKRMPYDGRSR